MNTHWAIATILHTTAVQLRPQRRSQVQLGNERNRKSGVLLTYGDGPSVAEHPQTPFARFDQATNPAPSEPSGASLKPTVASEGFPATIPPRSLMKSVAIVLAFFLSAISLFAQASGSGAKPGQVAPPAPAAAQSGLESQPA